MSAQLQTAIPRLIIGLILSVVVALFAQRRRALTSGGALAAVLVGTITLGFGGWAWGLVLVAFFTSSSALSRYRRGDKRELAHRFGKGTQRDSGQVLANGGLAAILSLWYFSHSTAALLAAFLGALATVNADTWATEIGVLSPVPPRLVTTWRRVPVGTSGGVSLLGTAASTLGALFIGLIGYVLLCLETKLAGGDPLRLSWIIPTALVSGLLGSLLDSLLGATVQGVYYCARCEAETEKEVHGCGLRTSHLRGWRWLNNDVVNLLSSVGGAAVAMAVWGIISGW
jgi:uncharacterized protein (TIGR00297 family)